MIIKQQLLNSESEFTYSFSFTPSSELYEWTSVGNSEWGYRGRFGIQPWCFNLCAFVFQEHWYMSYIDLLQRFELWNVSNEVIKLSTCGAIMCLNQASTTLHINCSNCKRPMSNKGWICDRYDLQSLPLSSQKSAKLWVSVLHLMCLKLI